MAYQHDRLLKMYARNGLRTATEWSSLGREVEEGAAPRAEVTDRGQRHTFYVKDQTKVRDRVRNPATADGPPPSARPAPAAEELAQVEAGAGSEAPGKAAQ